MEATSNICISSSSKNLLVAMHLLLVRLIWTFNQPTEKGGEPEKHPL